MDVTTWQRKHLETLESLGNWGGTSGVHGHWHDAIAELNDSTDLVAWQTKHADVLAHLAAHRGARDFESELRDAVAGLIS